ncbi:flagellar basal body rod protein FlgF [Pectobacterium aroidearum]|jgi:flagellar basal-body rod protein FlgF|uniref:Flagellar basal-body rod protein FlgF n=2 Tax=Pectobacterium TaxID=122277 RepID=A0AAW3ST17_9GAMM|nr:MULTISPECIES: flagellar basal body rod protein FlgF [Pectobacterium]ACT13625.1 flagellar basal-body rod protein FlgF [Pectobacterium carotovorum subsp. carotovorum PC1]MBA0204455.1 flagellar basal body rod protein FlgF [Pectobacterium aroidearum]MBA5198826.1 flagellar basal body rod protein FlgF [Pectobacterium aroidearum]MBA5203127.1 flagellar basal body rod protein FlgF [Pectobacterium aroidearum]MBA5226671.1 flagellar basal body rod protein FlgF [Pectobacterium aroidearum]
MDHAIYTAMGGASQSLEKQAITANNLANASTPGFRAQLSALRAVPVNGLTLPTRTLVVASTPGADMTEGVMNYTGRAMDVALPKESWLAVQTANGGEAYTRNGNMEINADGQLTIQGRVVMGDGGPIDVPPQAQISISADGTISALNPGDPPNTIAQLGRLKLVKATGQEVERSDDGLFRLTQQAQQQRGNVLQNDPTVRIMPGVIEGSNVNTVDTMVDMIANARRFEMQMKVISSVDDNAQRANQILAMG